MLEECLEQCLALNLHQLALLLVHPQIARPLRFKVIFTFKNCIYELKQMGVISGKSVHKDNSHCQWHHL